MEEPDGEHQRKETEKSKDSLAEIAPTVGGDPAATRPAQTKETSKSAQYREYGMRALITVWHFIAWLFAGIVNFLDHNNGAVMAVATIAIGFLTWQYVRYSKNQWETMTSQLEVMKNDQRAWVSVIQKGGISVATNASLYSPMILSNSGKTPALNIVGHLYIEVIPNNEISKPHFENESEHIKLVTGVLMPNDPRDCPIHRIKNNVDVPFTSDEATSIVAGHSWIAVHGIIWYDDVNGTRRWTRFCVWHSAKPGDYNASSCTAYNSVGDKEKATDGNRRK
jgi:hypothetical protein